MRITGGELRSRRLLTLKSKDLRPAMDRLRETLFNILSNYVDLHDTSGIDLYAGTGSVGFEALSRGARHMVFVELKPKIAGVLNMNARELGLADKCRIVTNSAEEYVASCDEKFDVAFIDPPYSINGTTHEIVETILSKKLVRNSGMICVEHSRRYSPPESILIRQKIFGSTILSFIKPEIK